MWVRVLQGTSCEFLCLRAFFPRAHSKDSMYTSSLGVRSVQKAPLGLCVFPHPRPPCVDAVVSTQGGRGWEVEGVTNRPLEGYFTRPASWMHCKTGTDLQISGKWLRLSLVPLFITGIWMFACIFQVFEPAGSRYPIPSNSGPIQHSISSAI